MATKYTYLGGGIALILIILVLFVTSRNHSVTPSLGNEPLATTTPNTDKPAAQVSGTGGKQPVTQPPTPTLPKSNLNSYANAQYHFALKYPSYVKTRDGFFSFYQLGDTWRLNPPQGQLSQGKAIVSFSIYTIDQGTYITSKSAYPLFYTAEVRVAVSDNTKDCYLQDTGYANQVITNITINGIPFKKFSTSDAAMMKYIQGESYRTIHNKQCFVLEQVRAGSSYRDEKMQPGISQKTLDDYYKTGEAIIKTFTFTK